MVDRNKQITHNTHTCPGILRIALPLVDTVDAVHFNMITSEGKFTPCTAKCNVEHQTFGLTQYFDMMIMVWWRWKWYTHAVDHRNAKPTITKATKKDPKEGNTIELQKGWDERVRWMLRGEIVEDSYGGKSVVSFWYDRPYHHEHISFLLFVFITKKGISQSVSVCVVGTQSQSSELCIM